MKKVVVNGIDYSFITQPAVAGGQVTHQTPLT